MRKTWVFLTVFTNLLSLFAGWLLGAKLGLPDLSDNPITSPLAEKTKEKTFPLLKFSIMNLQQYPFEASKISIDSVLTSEPDYTSYQFSYQTYGKKMTGQVNIPTSPAPATGYPVILMARGWAPEETYSTGTGTRPAAAVFARNGYVTLAPDFLGYGDSDPDVENTWESRFIKPINMIELLKTVEAQKTILADSETVPLDTSRIGLWAHSNGGQISLTTLEILKRPIPTTLWAPVTAPFPYSLLFFTDEDYDEGKDFRKVLAQFEEDYNVHDFNFTQHLDQLNTTIQIHQGTADDAVPVAWSQDLADKIDTENERREKLQEEKEETATPSAEALNVLPPIDLNLMIYSGMDHNMRPNWDTVIQRDLAFFEKEL